jgi:hypothetical protein
MWRHGAIRKLGIRIGHQTPVRCVRLESEHLYCDDGESVGAEDGLALLRGHRRAVLDPLLRRPRRERRTASADARRAPWWAPQGHDLTAFRPSARDSCARTARYLTPAVTSLH